MRPLATAIGIAPALLAFSAHAEEAKKGMPQLDFANPLTISQVVWLAIIFLAFYLLLSKWGLPKVESVLEMRAGKIAADLDAARAAKAQADAAVAELTEATRTAQATARTQISAAVDQAKQAAVAQAAAFDAKLAKQLADAETQIAAARTAAAGALRQVASETTATLVGRLTGTAPDAQAVDNAVGALLATQG